MLATMSDASQPSQLDQLKTMTTVVADTGDIEAVRDYQPQDATTNPSLILKAVKMDAYGHLLEKAVRDTEKLGLPEQERVGRIADELLILFGREILAVIPGRVSTETDARLSFDASAIVAKGEHLIDLYEAGGIGRERILIKIASTWEGIQAARELEQKGIRCNLTLLFSLVQAVACAEAEVQLISPFVGRIYDWHKQSTGRDYQGADDPGVQSVKTIYAYYKKFGHQTEVMGASFRNIGQIIELAGCDLLTISPELLKDLAANREPLERKLSPDQASGASIEELDINEPAFRYRLNEDAMATEKTAEGIRRFAEDAAALEKLIASRL